MSKYRYKPEPPPVLLSDEISGSLRKLPGSAGASTLIRDRYKSLQWRGVIEPRVKVEKSKPSKKRKLISQGFKGQYEEQMANQREAEKTVLSVVK